MCKNKTQKLATNIDNTESEANTCLGPQGLFVKYFNTNDTPRT